jgi:Ran GTPase-activating protein (RanGAP) involved in mRNA processing and transport
MDAQERFGELRSLANGAPSEEAWASICALLDQEGDDDRLIEEVLPYLEHHLSDWPEGAREIPKEWMRVMLKGEPCTRARLGRKMSAVRAEEEGDLDMLLSSPDLGALTWLDLGYNHFDERALRILEEETHLTSLRWLSVSDSHLGHEGIVRILESPRLANLTHFIAAWCDIENDGAVALSRTDALRRLERIEFRGNRITPPEAQTLLRGRNFDSVRELAMGWNDIADAGVEAIADAPYLGQLRELCLENNSIGGEGVEYLVRQPAIADLEILRLYNNASAGMGDSVAVAIAESPYMSNLKLLDLSGNPVSSVGKEALAASRYLKPEVRAAKL